MSLLCESLVNTAHYNEEMVCQDWYSKLFLELHMYIDSRSVKTRLNYRETKLCFAGRKLWVREVLGLDALLKCLRWSIREALSGVFLSLESVFNQYKHIQLSIHRFSFL